MLRCLQRTEPLVTATTPARRRRWTYAEYCKIPADRYRHELIDGRHYVNPAPSPYHQQVAGRLFYQLMDRIEIPGVGLVFVAPIDVHLGRGSLVQPDIVVLRTRNLSIVGDKKLTGVPDLLVEVLSPSNRSYDRRTKRDRYERSGVREYWIVDPEARCIEQLVLRGRVFAPSVVCKDRIRLRALRGIEVDLSRVW